MQKLDQLDCTEKLLRRSTCWTLGYHFGIMLGDGTVVHWSDRTFLPEKDTFEDFARGYCVEEIEYESPFTREQVSERAMSLLGREDMLFRLFANNCESLVRWCILDRWFSWQSWVLEIAVRSVFVILGLRDKIHLKMPTIWDILLYSCVGSQMEYTPG
jgi:hypothetical protein